MVEKFFPDEIVDKVQDIKLDVLAAKGIKGMVLDIDNTLVPTFRREADNDVVDWIEKVKSRGFKLCIVSNATRKRVDKFNEKLGLKAICMATKPIGRSFRKALRILNLKAYETAAVGDQIFTDIYGGNRLGMYTILVKPIHRKESLFVKLKRHFEKYVFDRYYEAKGKGKSR